MAPSGLGKRRTSSRALARNYRAVVGTARYVAMLVAIDQITSVSTPGKKPKPDRLSSPKPDRTAANATRNETAPMSATTPVQRAKTPLRSVTSPPAMRNAAKPIAESRKGPAEALPRRGSRSGPRRHPQSSPRDHDDRHGHARHARYGTRERDPSELCRTANSCLRIPERVRIVPAKCRNTKPASSIANAPMRLFHWLSSAQFVQS